MLVFNEGLPRSGKSYDAMLNHILPALKRGRPVFARLNGMDDDACRDSIAARLGKSRQYVDQKLVHIDTADVVSTFRANQSDSRKWTIDLQFKNALVVIDEIHEFFVGGTREQLDPASEQFFALHGHYGMDILIMSQHYKRTHTAVRYRIERKNVFQKLTALGKMGETRYQQAYYQAIAPDKYEQVSSETHSYDATLYPCYHGIVPATEGEGGEEVTQAVYDGGRTNVWRAMRWRLAVLVPLLAFAVWYLVGFFTGHNSLVKSTRIGGDAPVSASASAQPSVPGVAVKAEPRKSDIHADQTEEQKYIGKLSEDNRVRVVAMWGDGQKADALVEWIDSNGVAKERMRLDKLRALGCAAQIKVYGVRIMAGRQVIIATQWPLDQPLRDERPQLYNTAGQTAGARVSVSEPVPGRLGSYHATGAASRGDAQIGAYGGMRGAVGQPPAFGGDR